MARYAAIISVCLFLIANVSCGEVTVNFMDFNTREWLAVEHEIKKVVTSQLNEYCSDSVETCGLTSTNNVSASVTFAGSKGSTFTIEGRYAIVKISGVIGETALTSEVLEGILNICFISEMYVFI